MRVSALLPTIFIASASALSAQQPRVMRIGPGTVIGSTPGQFRYFTNQPRAVIGVSTTSGASSRDTLGVLVSVVRSGSPADKAGIEEGNRIASVNGVSLKLAAADIGDDEMAGVLSRRLSRELDKLKPGDEVDLRVYANGQTKSVKVKTISPDDLDDGRTVRAGAGRATLGLSIGSTGSSRDSLGVFVMGVEDGSPAAKAGIDEGSRIASINGVDLRGRPSDDDDFFRSSNVTRLEREVSRLQPGDTVNLRVYFNGQYRNVKVTAARMSDLPRQHRSIRIIGGDNFAVPPIPDRLNLQIDGRELGDQLRRALDEARIASDRGMGAMQRVLQGFGRRVDW